MISFLFLNCQSYSSKDGIFQQAFHDKIIVIDVSGSSKQYINGSFQYTKPEYSVYPWNKDYDWCSNCGKSSSDHPWITYSLQSKKIKLTGYFVRCGCCYASENCCCEDESTTCFDCCLYSWSLQVSDDNKTWKEVHRIEKDESMRRCNENTYKLDREYTTKYVRLIQNEPCPGDPPCIAINKFDLIGEVVNDNSREEDFVSYHDDDDDVSIIGHISKNGNVRFN
ncbi:hypothetical protein TVAG_372690 [Trichomonas vaginalis G3]|uniref:F5/8 type C domain-containing protein n=1 Tax=Trichomonas vaginalis (strain ATCC PRA-98 / G3) TaxID=412133 RepID=A2EZ12_TRIV3|nr:hypothetical protein TVAGG3_0373000 [Trichomonas vaginalis G3]EAY02124.1 hypothetical protein TVAG_372690 [Trichomonas vaginalis G3]KAI5532731.1 hypothetical protein TVAGG3_0373000 [Trichomonas vaginalis G3]|eukprot:XP_001330544.1 hypothetical protein [Trichomonas vaginalis G3]